MPIDPTAALVRNMIDLQRFENTVSKETLHILEAAFAEVVISMIRLDPLAVTPGRLPRRMDALMKAMDSIIGPAYSDVRRVVMGSLIDVAGVQQTFAIRQLERATAGIDVSFSNPRTRAFWREFVTSRRIRGSPMGEWWADQHKNVRKAFSRELQIGLSQGESIDDLVRRIRGRAVGSKFVDGKRVTRFAGGVMQTITRHAESLVRTAVNQISNDALFETFSDNPKVTEEYRYTATLDGKTSHICIALDGRVFRYDDPNARRPSQHYRCRSTMVPIVDFDGLGLDTPVEGKRAAKGGAVDASTDYPQWLRAQDKIDPKVTDDILGVGRAKLFRSGKLDLRTIVRRDGSTISLADLRKRNS